MAKLLAGLNPLKSQGPDLIHPRIWSCETRLVNVIGDCSKCLDKGLHVDTFVLDFAKAFDTVPHELLKLKLHQYGVSKQVLNWISGFLSNRTQSVVVN